MKVLLAQKYVEVDEEDEEGVREDLRDSKRLSLIKGKLVESSWLNCGRARLPLCIVVVCFVIARSTKSRRKDDKILLQVDALIIIVKEQHSIRISTPLHLFTIESTPYRH